MENRLKFGFKDTDLRTYSSLSCFLMCTFWYCGNNLSLSSIRSVFLCPSLVAITESMMHKGLNCLQDFNGSMTKKHCQNRQNEITSRLVIGITFIYHIIKATMFCVQDGYCIEAVNLQSYNNFTLNRKWTANLKPTSFPCCYRSWIWRKSFRKIKCKVNWMLAAKPVQIPAFIIIHINTFHWHQEQEVQRNQNCL